MSTEPAKKPPVQPSDIAAAVVAGQSITQYAEMLPVDIRSEEKMPFVATIAGMAILG